MPYIPQLNGNFSSSLISETIHLSPGLLAFTIEPTTLPTNVSIVIFEVKNSFGDVFAVTLFMKLNVSFTKIIIFIFYILLKLISAVDIIEYQ